VLRRAIALAATVLPACAQFNVLTYQYDNSRAGGNANEAILTKANVNATQFGKLFSHSVDGLVYAQPLYVANVPIAGKGVHNVVYVATEHDSVYAFDADSNSGANSASLWQVNFLNAAAGVTTFPAADTGCDQIEPEIGITGTPVIDPASGTIYLVAMTKETSAVGASYVARLHALDIGTGAERSGSPVVIQAQYPGTADGGSIVTLNVKSYKQRPGLLLLNGTVYTGWSSHCDGGHYQGWLIGYDARTLRQTTVYNSVPDGNMGSFWAGGSAPAADAAGNIYVVTGNGSFNYAMGGRNLGESYIKLSSAGGLAVADYFTPYNYVQLNNDDADVGSAGVALLGDEAGSPAHPHLMAGAGKEGRAYLLDRDSMGGLHAGSDQIVQSLPGAIGGMFGNPSYFNQLVYFCAANDNFRAFSIVNAQMKEISRTAAPFGFPGCVPTISANGQSAAIVWAIDPSGTLHAYDAGNLASELYNSNQNRARDAFGSAVKFSAPAVANGKVYAGTQNSLVVYGLLSLKTAVTNAASGDATAIAPGSIFSVFGSLPASGNVSVDVDGAPATLFYTSATQINALAPSSTPAGAATVTVKSAGLVVVGASTTVQPVVPGLFTLAGGHAAVLNQDFSVNSAANPAAAGSIIAAYLTGLGAVDATMPFSPVTAPVTATIGSTPATVQFAGLAPGYPGLYQVNIQVPQLTPGDYPLRVSAAGIAGNSAPVSVR
jgi:uncharacterized protein (TIGR03437 family)